MISSPPCGLGGASPDCIQGLQKTYYMLNKDKVLAKTRQKERCECGAEVSYSNRKCHKQSVRHIIYMKSRESHERLQNTNQNT